MAARRATLVQPLAAIGRRTLPIYVMRMPLPALLHRFCFAPLAAHHGDQAAFAMFEPAVLAVLLAAFCLTAHAALPEGRGRRNAGRVVQPTVNAGRLSGCPHCVYKRCGRTTYV